MQYRGRFLALILLIGTALLAFAPSPANAAGTGSISGTITDGDDALLANVCVRAYDTDGERAGFFKTGASGTYTMSELATGDYRLSFYTCGDAYEANLIPEHYDDKATLAEATPVAVTDGVNTPGIDVQLVEGGSISGIVTGSTGGITGPRNCVVAYDSNGDQAGYATAESDGSYTIEQLRTGDYRLEFIDCAFRLGPDGCMPDLNGCSPVPGLKSEFYDNEYTLADATPIPVTAGSETPNIDADLVPKGRILGTVTGEGAGPLGQICVRAFESDGDAVGFVRTDSNGNYTIDHLRSGDHRLHFSECGFPGHNNVLPEYYDDEETFAAATPVSVTDGSDTTDIDAELAPAGAVTGRVTDYSGTPLSGICVQAYESDDTPVLRGEFTDSDGRFRMYGLGAGEYRFRFSDCFDWANGAVAAEFYNDKETLAEAVPVTVEVSSAAPIVFAQLEVRRGGGPIGPPDPPPGPGPGPTETKALISKVSVKGPAKVKKGKKATFTVKITNSGNADATGVKLGIKGRGASFGKSVGTIPAGATKTVKAKLKPKRAGKIKLTFSVISSNAGDKGVKRNLTVKK